MIPVPHPQPMKKQAKADDLVPGTDNKQSKRQNSLLSTSLFTVVQAKNRVKDSFPS